MPSTACAHTWSRDIVSHSPLLPATRVRVHKPDGTTTSVADFVELTVHVPLPGYPFRDSHEVCPSREKTASFDCVRCGARCQPSCAVHFCLLLARLLNLHGFRLWPFTVSSKSCWIVDFYWVHLCRLHWIMRWRPKWSNAVTLFLDHVNFAVLDGRVHYAVQHESFCTLRTRRRTGGNRQLRS